jgi:hypothetical protein
MIYTKHIQTQPYIELPSVIEDTPLTGIGAKAFLSHKEIHKLALPDSVEHIDDWAFAHMHNLRELHLPARNIRFGKKVFLDCNNLEQICLFPDRSSNPGLPYFLASAITVFNDISLLDPIAAASVQSNADWMQAYDKLLIEYLQKDDAFGFEPIFYGWFNDEDADVTQLPNYLKTQRHHKTRLTFLRLQYDLHLSASNRAVLHAYLCSHMPWGDQAHIHTYAWDVLPAEYAHDILYPRIWESAGMLTPDTVPQLIAHLKEANPEVIAYLLRYQEKNTEFTDFFDNFSL